jgi:hypothetical protein
LFNDTLEFKPLHLMVCNRSRLKGCEAEVAKLLDTKWKHITFDWETEMDMNDIPMDGRRGM